ncbi:MAG: hypothetical protein ACO280_12295, partial [Pseudohongiellaceae bacterium]
SKSSVFAPFPGVITAKNAEVGEVVSSISSGGNSRGSVATLVDFDTLEVLGIHCFGDQASEIVHIGQAVMKQQNGGNSLRYFLNTTFNYPTMAEAYKVAALDGINRVF